MNLEKAKPVNEEVAELKELIKNCTEVYINFKVKCSTKARKTGC